MTDENRGAPAELTGPIRVRGEMLDYALRARGMSQAKLAAALGTSEGHVSRVVNGQGGVSVGVMADILDVFGNRLRLRELAVIDAGDPVGDRTAIS